MNTLAKTTFSPSLATLPVNEPVRQSKCPFGRLTAFLLRASKVESRPGGDKAADGRKSVLSWIRNFVAKAHPELGRNGSVCPFLPRALKEDSLMFQTINADHLSAEQLDELVRQYASLFLAMEPTTGNARLNKTIVLIFQGLSEEHAPAVIEAAHARLKPYFVERALMLGEFHKTHEAAGVHNPNFLPLQSPLPLLVIRYMVKSDRGFLDRDCYEPELRARFMRAYDRAFA